MTAEEREAKMREIGLELPKKKMAELNRQMDKMAQQNYQKLLEESAKKMTKTEIATLRKLGLSPEFIANMDPDVNPFQDQGLGKRDDFSTLADVTKNFYEELKNEYLRVNHDAEITMDGTVEPSVEDLKSPNGSSPKSPKKLPITVKPAEYDEWNLKKQLEFDRKRLFKLQEFLEEEIDNNKRNKTRQSFLRQYTQGELGIFTDMLNKMIQSKNYEIFQQMQIRKVEKQNGEGAIKDETESEDDPLGLQEVTDEDASAVEEEISSNHSTQDAYGNRIPRKLKPSGVITQIMIDPDETSDEENNPVKKMLIKEELRAEHGPGRRSSQLMVEEADAIKEKQKKFRQDAADKKARERKYKDVMRQHGKKDRKETYKFLIKHGLTIDEAKDYTQLTKEFDLSDLPESTKKSLSEDFKAQVFAFRKLRERLLMSDNPARIYDKISIGMPNVGESLKMSKAELEQYLNDAKTSKNPIPRLSVEKSKTIVTLTQD